MEDHLVGPPNQTPQGDLLIVARRQLSINALRSFLDTKGLKVGEALLADGLHELGAPKSKRNKR